MGRDKALKAGGLHERGLEIEQRNHAKRAVQQGSENVTEQTGALLRLLCIG